MLRHEFRPGRLLAGLFFALAGVIYAGDAGGLWETPWFAVIPVVLVGLALSGAAGATARSVRRRRAHRPGPGDPPEPPGPGHAKGAGPDRTEPAPRTTPTPP